MKPDAATVSVYDAKTQEYKKPLKDGYKEVKVEANSSRLSNQAGQCFIMDVDLVGPPCGYCRKKVWCRMPLTPQECRRWPVPERGCSAASGFHDFEATQFYDGIWASFLLCAASTLRFRRR